MNPVFDESCFERLERELGITLPVAYRNLLLSYPFAIDSDPYNWSLYGDLERIIQENKEAQISGFWGVDWPQHYLIIGGDGTGNVYFLDTQQTQCQVLAADHGDTACMGSLEFTEESSSFTEYVQILQQEQEEWETEEDEKEAVRINKVQATEEHHGNKKWWQFWL